MSKQPSREARADFWREQIVSWQASGQSQCRRAGCAGRSSVRRSLTYDRGQHR